MFHPVGSQPPSVYWRRRLLVLGSIVLVIVLLVLTVRAIAGGSGGSANAAKTSTPANSPASTPAGASASSSSSHPSSSASSSAPHSSASHTAASSPAPAPAPCDPKGLTVKAVVGKPSYQVGDTPLLELQVTNVGAKPCVQDLADKQVELRVYNGESRVWGSHDCQVQPGTDLRTLAVNTPVLVAITWSGLSSQPACAGTRQRVGAGTYTLYALLAGRTGTAAQFVIN